MSYIQLMKKISGTGYSAVDNGDGTYDLYTMDNALKVRGNFVDSDLTAEEVIAIATAK
jgi:hypothetical protein